MQITPFVVDREEAGPLAGSNFLATKGKTITGPGDIHSRFSMWLLELAETGIKMKELSLHQIVFKLPILIDLIESDTKMVSTLRENASS